MPEEKKALPPEYIEACKRELADLREQLKYYESGEIQLRQKDNGGKWEDVTEQHRERFRRVIKTYEDIVAHSEVDHAQRTPRPEKTR